MWFLDAPILTALRQRIVLAVGAVIIPLSAFASAEVTPPTVGPPVSQVSEPRVATNGSRFLTLWSSTNFPFHDVVFGSLADSDGKVLTPVAFPVVANGSLRALFPMGSGYVAILDTGVNNEVHAVRLSADGVVQSRFTLHPGFHATIFAFDGTKFLIVGGAPPGLLVCVMTADDHVLRQPILFSRHRYTSVAACVQRSGFLLVTLDPDEGLYQQGVSPDGEVMARTLLAPADLSTGSLGLGCRPDTALVAWGQSGQLSMVSTDSSGSVTGRTLIPDPFTLDQQRYERLSITPAGESSFVLIAATDERSTATRLNGLASVEYGPLAIGGGLAAASAGGTIYSARRTNQNAIEASPIHLDAGRLSVSDTQVLSITLRRQAAPRITSDGLDHLLAWRDEIKGTIVRPVIRVRNDGAPIDSVQTDLRSASEYSPGPPSIAFGRSVYLVVWSDALAVMGRLVSRQGIPQGDSFRIVHGSVYSSQVSDQAVAWNGSEFRVISSSAGGIASSAVTEEGRVSPPQQFAQQPGGRPFLSKILWDGNRFLVSFKMVSLNVPRGHNDSWPIGFYRLARDGSLIAPATPAILGRSIRDWHLASSGSGSLVVTDEEAGSPDLMQTVSRTIRADGPDLQLDPPQVLFDWVEPTASDVSWDGRQYVLSWMYGSAPTGWWITLGRSAAGERPQKVVAARMGEPLPYDLPMPMPRPAEIRPPAFVELIGPAISANSIGTVVVGTNPASPIPRLRTFTEEDMTVLPEPPPAPQILSAVQFPRVGSAVGTVKQVTWTISPAAIVSGFLIEGLDRYAAPTILGRVGPEDRSFVVTGYGYESYQSVSLRVRSFNAGGLSEPAVMIVGAAGRRRGALH